MLLEIMEKSLITICICNDIENDYVIISYNNPVLEENEQNYGLSYLVDSLIFNELCAAFDDYAEIRAFTGYEMSTFSFNFNCDFEKANIFDIVDFLKKYSVDAEYAECLKSDQIVEIKTGKTKPEDVADYKMSGNKRYLLGIKGTESSLNNLSADNYKAYYKDNFLPYINIVICTNNCDKYKQFINQKDDIVTVIKPDYDENNQFSTITSTRKRSNRKIGEICFYHRFSSETIKDINCEAVLCEYIRYKNKSVLDKASGEVGVIRNANREYLRIKLLGSVKKIAKLSAELLKNIRSLQMNEKEFDKVKKTAGLRERDIFSDETEIANDLSRNYYYKLKYDNDYFINPETCYNDITIEDLKPFLDEIRDMDFVSDFSEKENETIREMIN